MGEKTAKTGCFENGICILLSWFSVEPKQLKRVVKDVLGNTLSVFRHKYNIVNFAHLRGYEEIKMYHHIHSIVHMTHIDIQFLAAC